MTFFEAAESGVRAIRGHVVTFTGDPYFVEDALVDYPDGVVLIDDGVITRVGPYTELSADLADVTVDHYPGCLISAGFIDGHIHYPQTQIIAAFGKHLIDWLNDYTFVAEQQFDDKAHADAVAKVFHDELLRNGTTTALTFAATYPQSVDALFEESQRRNMRMLGGKVMMDRNAPEALLDTAQSSYDDSAALIEKWHGKGRLSYAVTPRFAPTSTREQLDMAGRLLDEYPGTYMHTHLAEQIPECQWVASLFPNSRDYLDVYDQSGLVRERSVFAHSIHLSTRERVRISKTGAAVTHCPTSNLFLGSGLFPMMISKNPKHPMRVAMGTDIGAGTQFSMLSTMGEAYKVSELRNAPLDGPHLLYVATLGGARALYLDDRIGSLEAGKEADVIVLDPKSTPLLEFRSEYCTDIQELIFVLATIGDDRAVKATYVAGHRAYARDGE